MSNPTGNVSSLDASTNSTAHSSRPVHSLEMYVFCIHFLFGLPMYIYMIWLIVTSTRSGVASEFFNLNLSVCEIGNSLNEIFSILSIFFSSFTMLTQFLQGLGITGRPLFQCLMCVERYLAVLHPVTFLKYKPLRYRVICCAVAWIIILGSCLFCVFMLSKFNLKSYVLFFSSQFLLFLSIQLFCLVAVLRALKQSGPGERQRKREENNMKRRACYLILITTTSLIVQYSPYTITGFFVIVTRVFLYNIWSPALLCFVLTGFVQPILYLQRARKPSCFCSS